MDLNGTVVVVTGASGGLGGGIARAFAAAGAAVVVHYRSSTESAAEVVGDIIAGGGRAISAQCDITDPESCTRLMATAVEAFGRLDTVVANAGVQPVAELATMSVPQWREVIDTNLTGGFATVQAAASAIREQGSGGAIILIGSIEGAQPAWSHAHYCASKATVIHFARTAALEYGRYGIRVNSVSPGLIWREGLDLDWPDGIARFRRAAPLGRLGRPRSATPACSWPPRWPNGSPDTISWWTAEPRCTRRGSNEAPRLFEYPEGHSWGGLPSGTQGISALPIADVLGVQVDVGSNVAACGRGEGGSHSAARHSSRPDEGQDHGNQERHTRQDDQGDTRRRVRHQEACRQEQQTQRDHQRVVHGTIPHVTVARPPQPQPEHPALARRARCPLG